MTIFQKKKTTEQSAMKVFHKHTLFAVGLICHLIQITRCRACRS